MKQWWEGIKQDESRAGQPKESKPTSLPSEEHNYKKIVGRVVGMSLECESFLATPEKCREKIKEQNTGSASPVSSSPPCFYCTYKGNILNDPSAIRYPLNCDCCCGGERTVFTLDPPQKAILSKQTSNRLVLKGGYGTGKSLILKLKAIELAKKGEKVLYVIGNLTILSRYPSEDGYIFNQQTERDFKTIEEAIKKELKKLQVAATMKKNDKILEKIGNGSFVIMAKGPC